MRKYVPLKKQSSPAKTIPGVVSFLSLRTL